MLRLCFINVLLLLMSRGETVQVFEETEQYDSVSQSGSFSCESAICELHKNPCVFRGRLIGHTESISLDPCTSCRCSNGTLTCNIQSCPAVIPCGTEGSVIIPELCCPQCAGIHVEQDCEFRGSIYKNKQRWHSDPCTLCTCGRYGRTSCHRLSCGHECEVSELYHHPDLCCPLCPYEIVVKGVRISHIPEFTSSESNSHKVRFSLHVEVAIGLSSKTVQGENLWRVGVWMSENEDGSGDRMSFHPNIFDEENAAKTFRRRNPTNFKWPDLEYSTEPAQASCGKYLCVEFDQHDDPSPQYDLTFTFQALNNEKRRLVDCIPYSYCHGLRPKMHIDLTMQRIFERNLGDEIIFECNVTNAHTIWWKHSSWAETKRVSSNSTYRIDSITLADQGSYYCQARGHGQHIRSAEQILIVPGILQFLLTIQPTKSHRSSLHEMAIYQTHIANKLEEAGIVIVPLNISTENTEFYLNTILKPGQEMNNINRNIQSLVQRAAESAPASNISDVSVRLDGLFCPSLEVYIKIIELITPVWYPVPSTQNCCNFEHRHPIDAGCTQAMKAFCVEDSITTEVGNLSFQSVSLNTETVSNEHCVVPSRLPRGSRRCEGELITATRWTDLNIRNCFNGSTTEETSRRIDLFFEILENRTLTISDVPYISGDLVDITEAKPIGREDITQISYVLDAVSSTQSTSPVVTSNVLHTVDQIMDSSKGLSEDRQLSVTTSSRILRSVELQLENFQKSGENFGLILPNIGVKVVQIPQLDEPTSFAVCLSSDRKDEKVSNDALHMSINEHDAACKNGAFIYIPSVVMNLPVNDLNQKVMPVTFSRYQTDVLFNDEKSREDNKRLNSIIISASTSKEVDQLPKGSFIRTTFNPLLADNFESKFTCVFWDHFLYNKSGGWSSEGCHNEEANDSYVYICKCDHFGNIAVLVDLTSDRLSNNTVLVVCIIVIIIIVATICTFLVIKVVQRARRKEFRYQESAIDRDDIEPLELNT